MVVGMKGSGMRIWASGLVIGYGAAVLVAESTAVDHTWASRGIGIGLIVLGIALAIFAKMAGGEDD